MISNRKKKLCVKNIIFYFKIFKFVRCTIIWNQRGGNSLGSFPFCNVKVLHKVVQLLVKYMIHEISPMDPKSPQILSMKTSNYYFGAALHFSPYNYLVCENTKLFTSVRIVNWWMSFMHWRWKKKKKPNCLV